MNNNLYTSTTSLTNIKYYYVGYVKHDYFNSVILHLLNSIKILEDRINELEKKVN